MNTTVIHHSADFDGIFCREIARKFLPNAELIGWDFADPPLAVPDGRIYVLDLPVDRVFGLKFGLNVPVPSDNFAPFLKDVVWIDHHKTSIDTHPPEIAGYRIDGVAACRLAWQWFTHDYGPNNPRCQPIDYNLPQKDHYVAREVTEPLAVRLAGEYDVWDKRDPEAEIFQFALRSRELTAEDWNVMLGTDLPAVPNVLLELMKDGRLLQRYQQRNDANLVNYRSFMVEWEGLKFLTLNTGSFNSLTFAAKDVPETGHDALLGFRWDGKRWSVSLYHARHRTDLDLSEIAKRHGGGGHRGACGFVCQTLPWIQ